MFKQIKEFFFGKPTEAASKEETKVEAVNAAPYKVEPPAPTKCGCGRSPTGNCVGHHKLSDAEWATHADNPAAKKPKKAPAKKRTFVKREEKPAAIKAPAKPKAPRKPKAK